ncbi:MAG: riboflavin synthase [Candidatus Omnitrophota bacterium]
MFTGIVEQLGKVKAIENKKNLIVFQVDALKLASYIRVADSVAINGVCLTVTAKKGRVVSFDLMKETIETTSLRQVGVGSGVNMELALKANSRFGGHFVSGHVDETGSIKKIETEPNWVSFTISISKASQKYIVPKGSVTLDGVSLTVGKVKSGSFEVYLIPYTLKVTNLGAKKVGDSINIETDILAKYILSGRTK